MLLNKEMAKGSKSEAKPRSGMTPETDDLSLSDKTVNLGVPGDVHAAFKAFCEARSASQRGLAGKILMWYMRQPDIVMSAVLGTDKGMQEAYARALEEMAKQVREQGIGILVAEVGNRPKR